MTSMSEHWFPADAAALARVPEALRPWLVETGSLTQRLKQACPGEFRLKVLGERDRGLPGDIATVLGLSKGDPALEREVHLCCDDTPCIHARSWLPHDTLTGAGGMLASLGERPLGDALFSLPGLSRGPIEIAETPQGWSRRSVFRVEGQPLLVSECFLEGIELCCR